ncbi:hypothetical protein R69888_01456 [Paraburkholderia haematera]|uniref:Uncharacterized protein n=1 Tax=Paraburkholderia haematera TaxID=2793077 RepID=A0ABN7KYY7_9BURK|nr:hypothetical protein R69888_01456 [Paraburkholderia haematera]
MTGLAAGRSQHALPMHRAYHRDQRPRTPTTEWRIDV